MLEKFQISEHFHMLISFPQYSYMDWWKASRKSINDVSILELLQNLYDYQVGWWCFVTWPWLLCLPIIFMQLLCWKYSFDNWPPLLENCNAHGEFIRDNTVSAFSLFDNQKKSVKTRNSVQGHGDFKFITKITHYPNRNTNPNPQP